MKSAVNVGNGVHPFHPPAIQDQASFRDPSGRLFFYHGRVLRALGEPAAGAFHETWDTLKRSTEGIVATRFLPNAERQAILSDPELSFLEDLGVAEIVEHEPAPFANYPHEWAPEMLHAAGSLTMDLAQLLLPAGIGLKDATPSNVMFWGAKPVFLDVLSFEKRRPLDPTWLPQAQFVRTFLLPLLVNRRFGMSLSEVFVTRRDGLEPEHVYPMLGWFDRLRPRNLGMVSLPVWFGKRSEENAALYKPRELGTAEQASFVLAALLKRQQRALDSLRPASGRSSTWSDYATSNNNYSADSAQAKAAFAGEFLSSCHPGRVLDVGCNTGIFSMMAAESGAGVVAIDLDPVVVGRLWRVAREKNADVLPLVVNLSRPSPALGWSNGECRSFLDRAEGAFDAVFMLALIHHLLVSERVPLPQIFSIARRLTRKWLLIEYVDPADSMFQRLTRGRAHLHEGFDQRAFESVAQRYFRIVRSASLPGTNRRLYLMEALWPSSAD